MTAFTPETRNKITITWRNAMKEKGTLLPASEQKLLEDPCLYMIPEDMCTPLEQLLYDGKYRTLGELYRKQFPNLVNICVRKAWQDDFYYALDQMNQYQMTAGWFRRSLRSNSYAPFVADSIRLLYAFSLLDFYDAELADILTGNAAPEYCDHARNEHFNYAGILAAQLDRHDARALQAVRDILFGENNTLMLSHELVLGIVRSKNKESYEALGAFLLAARLQEGARQEICETMDAGQPEAFLHLLSVIENNNLIRYTAVRRAVYTWTGIRDERGSDKTLRLMGQCLRDESFLQKQLSSTDITAICCAIWAKGFYDAQEAINTVITLVKNGTKHQKMTASYFMHSLQEPNLRMQLSKEVIRAYPDDLELVACFLPGFLGSAKDQFLKLSHWEHTSSGEIKILKPHLLPLEKYFQDKEEAAAFYDILKNLLKQLPKKGLTLPSRIFPFHYVSMTRSDIALRLCLIAWILQQDRLLDEAAGLISLIGRIWQESDYCYSTVRSYVAEVLLYRPATEPRKKALFELLHNAEEDTNISAHQLVEDMLLTPEDYRAIEETVKYKRGRTRTLALLMRQDKEDLIACINRLLTAKSEECRMGALDLALQLKKEDMTTFARILPSLRAFLTPSKKEKLLLDELLGSENGALEILNTPGYGLYDVTKDWILPPVTVNADDASTLFTYDDETYIRIMQKLDALIAANKEREYISIGNEEMLLGNRLSHVHNIHNDPNAQPLDAYPFRELWEQFYEQEVKTPRLMIELELYRQCLPEQDLYLQHVSLYQKVLGRARFQDPPFTNLTVSLSFRPQVDSILSTLFLQYVPKSLRVSFGLCGIARLLTVLDTSNDLLPVQEKLLGGTVKPATYRPLQMPVFSTLYRWIMQSGEESWESSFALRFRLQLHYYTYHTQKREPSSYLRNNENDYISLSDCAQCYMRGIWDKDLFYKAVYTFFRLDDVITPVSSLEAKGKMPYCWSATSALESLFGKNTIKPVNDRYSSDTIYEEMPEMVFAHSLYQEILHVVLTVELTRGEQPTPFSDAAKSIRLIYGIDHMIQILTALGKAPLDRGNGYYYESLDRQTVLSHLLRVSWPKPEETAADLKKALQDTDITKKRLVELAMYAQQWIPMLEEYFALPGFASACYYFMAHTRDLYSERVLSAIARYTPLSPEELRDGAFDVHWFFEAYEKLGEKNFNLLYDAAKYSSSGTAHARARKYADAALGKVTLKALTAQIEQKRNKDLLMSLGLLPFSDNKKAREAEILERYCFIQKFKKESRQFGALRRASEGHAVEIALRNLSVNAGFTDVTRLVLRMEGQMSRQSAQYFDWQPAGEIELMIAVDENGKCSLKCRKDGNPLKSVPTRYKKDETVQNFQTVTRQLKEQYRRTKQMMEQAMEDRTAFEVWEFLEMYQNPVARPITERLVVRTITDATDRIVSAETPNMTEVSESAPVIGFLTPDGIADFSGAIHPVDPEDHILIAHPFDLYKSGHWHEYQKLLFDRQIKQPFKQVFRELYVKLDEELEKEASMLFSGNQIQPRKTVGVLRSRRWVADYEDGLQKIYYKENIVAYIFAMADWFSPSDAEAPTLEYVAFTDRKTGKPLKIREIPDVIYSEVMRDVDLAVSVAYAGGVDPETSHSTIEMRKAIVACNLSLFGTKNVRLEGNHAIIDGKLGQYSIHLGSGVVHQIGNAMLFVLPVHSQRRGRIFLPFVDDDPKTAEIMSKILLFADDGKIKDPKIIRQIQ